MPKFFEEFATQLNELLAQQTRTSKIIAASILIAILGFCGLLMMKYTRSENFAVLYAHLDEPSANLIKQELKVQDIPFRLNENNDRWTIFIPEELILDLRLDLATTINSVNARPGWGLFDKTTLGETSQKTSINLLRAMEGERERTLSHMEGIKIARVNLVLPKDSLFVQEEGNKPKASVLLGMRDGFKLKPKQVKTIQALVAGGVDGLDADRVVIADTQGNELTRFDEVEPGQKVLNERALLIQQQKDQRREFESYLENKILTAFEKVFGIGHVTAHVNVEFDFTEKKQSSIVYDKEKSVPIAELITRTSNGKGSKLAQGPTGSTIQVGDGKPAGGAQSGISEFTEENITNYNVSETSSEVQYALYKIDHISAAVMVDHMPEMILDDEGEVVGQKRVPVSEDQMTSLENQVKRIINYSQDRLSGFPDEVSVTNVRFNIAEDPPPRPQVVAERKKWQKVEFGMRWGSLIVIGLLLMWFIVRPLMQMIAPVEESLIEGPQELALPGVDRVMLEGPGGSPELEEAAREAGALAATPNEDDIAEVRSKFLDEEILDLVRSNPKKVPLVIRNWLDT